MIDALEHKINHFFRAFSNLVKFIENECKNRIEGSILACTYIDSLAGYRYGGNSNRERFAKFIKEYSGMRTIYELISLPLLKYEIMKEVPQPESIVHILVDEFKIKEFNFRKLGHNIDVNLEQLESRLQQSLTAKDMGLLRKFAERFEYTAILWRDYRGNLIHETKLPDEMAMNLDDSTEPYYTSMLIPGDEDPSRSKITFGIPPNFILKTLKSCLKSYEEDCRTNRVDPFKNVS